MDLKNYLSRVRRRGSSSSSFSSSSSSSWNDDRPSILRVDNCSEIDVAGRFYKQNGTYYDDCCDLQNAEAPECQTCLDSTVCIIVLAVFSAFFVLFLLLILAPRSCLPACFCDFPCRCFCTRRICCQREGCSAGRNN